MPALNSLVDEFEGSAGVLGVYIREAHATDEWPISSSRCNGGRGVVNVNQHKTASERCAVAEQFSKDFGLRFPLLVDAMDDSFDSVYAPWPLRFFVVHLGKLLYIAYPQKASFNLAECREVLKSVTGKR